MNTVRSIKGKRDKFGYLVNETTHFEIKTQNNLRLKQSTIMATQDKKGKIRGKINNIVYGELGNKQVMHIAPPLVRQTYAIKVNAMELGLERTPCKVNRNVFRCAYEKADDKK